jgi:hypothetical protein
MIEFRGMTKSIKEAVRVVFTNVDIPDINGGYKYLGYHI